MGATPVDDDAEAPACTECGRTWRDGQEAWRAYLTDDEPAQLVIFCPTCASREFDVP